MPWYDPGLNRRLFKTLNVANNIKDMCTLLDNMGIISLQILERKRQESENKPQQKRFCFGKSKPEPSTLTPQLTCRCYLWILYHSRCQIPPPSTHLLIRDPLRFAQRERTVEGTIFRHHAKTAGAPYEFFPVRDWRHFASAAVSPHCTSASQPSGGHAPRNAWQGR